MIKLINSLENSYLLDDGLQSNNENEKLLIDLSPEVRPQSIKKYNFLNYLWKRLIFRPQSFPQNKNTNISSILEEETGRLASGSIRSVLSEKLELPMNSNKLSKANEDSIKIFREDYPSDFILEYDDLQNKPELFSGQYSDLQNKPVLFSGLYADLQDKPEIYDRTEIDNLIAGIETTGGSPQDLSLEGATLSISGGNSISFENWDTNAADDFDGEYSSLNGAPKVYTQDEVDAIKAEILKNVEDNYSKKAEIISFTSSRNINTNDVGNTIACINSSTLTITSGFSAMQIGDVINLEVNGTTLAVQGSSGVVINGKTGLNTSVGNNEVYSGGLIRKTGTNSYIVL